MSHSYAEARRKVKLDGGVKLGIGLGVYLAKAQRR